MEQNNTTMKHMEKNNMTAVEWFFEVLAHNDIINHKRLCDDENLYNLLYSLKNQAKQMEREQHNETWLTAQEESLHENYFGSSRLFLEYFKETYERK